MKPTKTKNPTKEIVQQVKAAMGCLSGDLRSVAHTSTFTVLDGTDSFTVTVERTTP